MPCMETHQKSITIPIMGFNGSGGLRVLSQIANHLVEHGWQVIFLTPNTEATPYFPLDDRILIKTYAGQGGMSNKLWHLVRYSYPSTGITLANYFATAYPVWMAWLLQGRQSTIVYLLQHDERLSQAWLSANRSTFIQFIKAGFIHSTYWLPFERLAVSSWIQERIQRPVQVIPNSIDQKVFYPLNIPKPKTSFTIGAIGRLQHNKGFHLFLEAIDSLIEDERFDCIVASDKPIDLPDGIKHHNIQSDDDMRAFYQTCDVFIFPSYWEGFGLPPLEAMACGTPVILTDSGGVREYATPSNSLLITNHDPKLIYDAIMKLYAHETHRIDLIEQGLKTAKAYSIQIMLDRYLNYFEQLRLK